MKWPADGTPEDEIPNESILSFSTSAASQGYGIRASMVVDIFTSQKMSTLYRSETIPLTVNYRNSNWSAIWKINYGGKTYERRVSSLLKDFDSTTLNTLWVDKNLRLHGLLQAFSRTNRILNSVKTYGNIVCFRDLEQATNDSISLFGNKDAGGIVILKPFREYYDEYSSLVSELTTKFNPGELPASETEQREFINLYNKILRLQNILKSFDDFKGNELLPERTFQDYQSTYIEIYQDLHKTAVGDRESIIEDLVFEIELVKQVEINVDFILILIRGLQGASASENKEIKAKINKTVLSSFSLRSKKDLIEKFIEAKRLWVRCR
jgi:type I restriction enzyme R subunit